MDTYSREIRSRTMAAIKGKDTKPEIYVRKLLHSLGYRYRLHKKTLPGSPDLVLEKYKTVIFINGCFWHRHRGCKFSKNPKNNKKYWKEKFKENIKRDDLNYKKLKRLGYKALVIWECETRPAKINVLTRKIFKILK